MPRPRKERNCRHHKGDRVFKPRSIPMPELQTLVLRVDELEALRLCDLEGFDQEAAGERMGVSRGTVQRLLKTARSTVVRAITENAALIIGGHELALPQQSRPLKETKPSKTPGPAESTNSHKRESNS